MTSLGNPQLLMRQYLGETIFFQALEFRSIFMAEFIAFDLNSEVAGPFVIATFEAMRRIGVNVRPFLEKHSLDTVKPDTWVNLQKFLDLLKDIKENSGNFFSLISLGKIAPEVSDLSHIKSIKDIFEFLNTGYLMSHRGGDIGEYITEFLGEHHIRITARNPYPSDFDYGLLWGAAKMFAPESSFVKVVRAESPCRLKGNDRCIYDITW
jgi:hypothetical protein